MIHEITMPALSSTMTEGKVVAWKKNVGEKVEKGDIIAVVESDKADMDVESFNEGYLANIFVHDGETTAVGSAIALLAQTKEEMAQAAAKSAPSSPKKAAEAAPAAQAEKPAEPTKASEPKSEPVSAPVAKEAGARIAVSPRARKLAQDMGIDLSQINGSGANGRIVEADVLKASQAAPAALPVAPAISTPTLQEITAQGFTTLQKAVIQNMEQSLTIPSFRVGYTVTTDRFDGLYQQLKSKGVTVTTLLAKAIATALVDHPLVNSSYTPNGLKTNAQINIAIAVAMDEGGLITPVLRDAANKDVYQLSREWKDLVARARSKKLQPEEYNSGTFTISNLGMFGVDRFDAMVPPGTGAILAIGASKPTVVVNDEGFIGVKRQMQIVLSGDHRVFYGSHAAIFLQQLAALIEQEPEKLTLL
ncbi:MAG: dihydrolipoamide acetyltransferase family protein [Gloeobacterales cyanobacterium]